MTYFYILSSESTTLMSITAFPICQTMRALNKGGNCCPLMGSFSLFMYMLGKIIGLQNRLNLSSWNGLYYVTKTFTDMATLKRLGWGINLDAPDGLNIITRLFVSQRHQTGIYRQLPHARRRRGNSQLESLKELSPTDILILSFLSFKTMQLHICVALNP